MRIGASSRGTWWISMGPLGWLLFGWLYLAVLCAAAVVWVVLWLVLAGVQLIDEQLEARRGRHREPDLPRLV